MSAAQRVCAALAVLAVACGTDSAPDTCGSDEVTTGVPASARATDVRPILAQYCALGGCHLHAPGAGGLVLDMSSPSWMNAVLGVRAKESSLDLVAAGDPERSWLVHKIYGSFCPSICTDCGATMPFGTALSDADRGTIVAWIAAGAQP